MRRFSGARVKPAREMTVSASWISLVHGLEAGDGAQRGGLAAAGRAQQAADVAAIQVQVEMLNDALLTIAAGQVAQL